MEQNLIEEFCNDVISPMTSEERALLYTIVKMDLVTLEAERAIMGYNEKPDKKKQKELLDKIKSRELILFALEYNNKIKKEKNI